MKTQERVTNEVKDEKSVLQVATKVQRWLKNRLRTAEWPFKNRLRTT